MAKVLVVDNDTLILEFMKDILSGHCTELRTAEDGLKALDILEEFKPDFIFLDLIMPNIDGQKLCRIIRSMDEVKKSFIVILSATLSAAGGDLEELGADACIEKGPFDEIERHVLSLIEQSEKLTERNLSAKKITADSQRMDGVIEELLYANRHFELILENMTEGIVEISKDGRMIFANKKALALISVPEERLLGNDFTSLFKGDDLRYIQDRIKQSLNTPVSDSQAQTLDLNDYKVQVEIIPVAEGYSNSIVIMKDLTEQLETEKALRESEMRYRFMSITDGLTGLYNSRHFSSRLKSETERANRYGHALSLLLMDLDNFKAYNDKYGHVNGDLALSKVARVIKISLRATDEAFRYGGEEFTIMLPDTEVSDACIVAERIRKGIEEETFDDLNDNKGILTTSIGAAQYMQKDDFSAFLKRVDENMYRAKNDGKNKVFFSDI